ncbi:unnamed protein product [Natator depressus]
MDYHKLNAVTCPDNYPVPCTDELLEKLGQTQFISTLDLTKGYWQVPLDESAKERSAFNTHLRLYEFNVLPFGLQNAPATFQRLVDGLLAGLEEYAVAYLDDVAIFSDSLAEHLKHPQKVFEKSGEGLMIISSPIGTDERHPKPLDLKNNEKAIRFLKEEFYLKKRKKNHLCKIRMVNTLRGNQIQNTENPSGQNLKLQKDTNRNTHFLQHSEFHKPKKKKKKENPTHFLARLLTNFTGVGGLASLICSQ